MDTKGELLTVGDFNICVCWVAIKSLYFAITLSWTTLFIYYIFNFVINDIKMIYFRLRCCSIDVRPFRFIWLYISDLADSSTRHVRYWRRCQIWKKLHLVSLNVPYLALLCRPCQFLSRLFNLLYHEHYVIGRIEKCVAEIQIWMINKMLKLKDELFIFAPQCQVDAFKWLDVRCFRIM